MKSFEPLLSLFGTIPDPRRSVGKLYQLPHVLLSSVFANSYRGIRTSINAHRQRPNKAFQIKWKRPPAHTAIRYILQGLSPAEAAVSRYSEFQKVVHIVLSDLFRSLVKGDLNFADSAIAIGRLMRMETAKPMSVTSSVALK